MTSIADRVFGTADAIARDAVAAVAAAPAISFPAVGERELRLDLFRGMALWLIFIDHLPPSLLTWFTIRNYGFSDATEIFIFISGYTAAFVYGRAMLESGFVVATARILRRVWQIYVAHVFLFTIFLAEISYVATRFENPLYSEEMGIMDFLKQPDVTIIQALLLRFRPVNMDVLPLYIVLMLFLPIILWLMKWRPDVTLGLSVLLYALTWQRPLILCGQHSLEIFCLGVFLAFAGQFVLAEVGGGALTHALVSLSGILIMWGVAWVISWYKHSADKDASKTKRTGGNADMAGGSV